ncbi:Gamma-tubulin complex component 3-like protein [Smittium culicis]|uniref:Gamma-tubulin complex component 3-like protein n=1 Tax=Smittium culicis TaxID=133412 RepID=A0A1R1X1A9_9FUNG|nr:Gamma-tubulin complex component 3-like protein [Smittium culicis]
MSQNIDNLQNLNPEDHEYSSINKESSVLLSQLAPRIDEISEDSLIRDILFVTRGVDGRYIFWDNNNQSYSIDPNITLSSPTMFLLDRLLELGELNHRVSNYIDSPQSSQSLVRQGFRLALSYELEDLFSFISELEHKHAEALASSETARIKNKLFLRKLYYEFQPQIQKLRVLASIIDSLYINTNEQEITTSSGGEMLSKIHSFTCDGAPIVKKIANKMLKASASSFNNILLRWITEGELEDPYKEFFVDFDEDSSSENSLWVGRYSIDVSKIPVYICSDLTRKIFLIGKSLSFLRTACGDEEWISIQKTQQFQNQSYNLGSNNIPKNSYTSVTSLFDISDPNSLKTHIDSIYQLVNARLMKVMIGKYDLMNHVAAMKKYLLLEQGDFVQFLVESLGNQLDKPSNRLLHHNIMTAVESAVRNSNAQYDSAEYTERISVRLNAIPQGENSGWSAFPITYHIESPITYVISESTMLKYNELTTFLLRLKRIEIHLHQLWQKQLVLKINKLSRKKKSSTKKNRDNFNSTFNELNLTLDDYGLDETGLYHLLQKMRICCGEMMHFIHQLERYIYLNAIEGAYSKFLKSIYGNDIHFADSTSLLVSSCGVEFDRESYNDDNAGVDSSNQSKGDAYQNNVLSDQNEENSFSDDISKHNEINVNELKDPKQNNTNPENKDFLPKNKFKNLKSELDLDQWIVAHDNYISEVRRLVMGKKRNYINIVEHILNTINLFCISSDYLFNDLTGVGNSNILFKKRNKDINNVNVEKSKAKESLGNFLEKLDSKSNYTESHGTTEVESDGIKGLNAGAANNEATADSDVSPVIEQVETTMKTFKHDIRNMLKLFAEGSDSTFLKGLAVSFDLNQYYTVGLGKSG